MAISGGARRQVAAHTDLVDCLGQHQRVEHFGQFEQRAAAIGALRHRRSAAPQCRDRSGSTPAGAPAAVRAAFSHRAGLPAPQRSLPAGAVPCAVSRAAGTGPEIPSAFTNSIMRSHSSRRMQRKKRSARCSAPAWVVRRRTSSRSGANRFLPQRLFNKFRQPVLDADPRAQIVHQHRTLHPHQLHGRRRPRSPPHNSWPRWLPGSGARKPRSACSAVRHLSPRPVCSPSLLDRLRPWSVRPDGEYRSANWLNPMAVLRRGSASLASGTRSSCSESQPRSRLSSRSSSTSTNCRRLRGGTHGASCESSTLFLPGFRHFRPEHAVQNVGVRLHQNPGLDHLVFLQSSESGAASPSAGSCAPSSGARR